MFGPRITLDYFSFEVGISPFQEGTFLLRADRLQSDALTVQSFERYFRPGALGREFGFGEVGLRPLSGCLVVVGDLLVAGEVLEETIGGIGVAEEGVQEVEIVMEGVEFGLEDDGVGTGVRGLVGLGVAWLGVVAGVSGLQAPPCPDLHLILFIVQPTPTCHPDRFITFSLSPPTTLL